MERLSSYTHDALFFASPAELVESAVPFLTAGLDAGQEAVLVCSDAHNRAIAQAVESSLGRHPRITYLSQSDIYLHAPSAIAEYRRFMQSRSGVGAPGVRLVGEVAFGDDERTWQEWTRFEAMCNVALHPYPLWSMCAYDLSALSPAVIRAGRLTHPHLHDGGNRSPNGEYVDPAELLRLVGDPALTAPVPEVPAVRVDPVAGLRQVREEVRDYLERLGAAEDVTDEMVLAASEVTANALRHGTAPVSVRLWRVDGSVVCSVTDQGPGFEDPFAGFVPGGGTHDLPEARMGLCLVRSLCDDLVHERTEDGFRVMFSRRLGGS
ncbi:MAG TPA: sensor histidine kinase [Nocardioidaceae bacterium]|nr:sensor histidine kinase [Nocardioidaceae bacterium]